MVENTNNQNTGNTPIVGSVNPSVEKNSGDWTQADRDTIQNAWKARFGKELNIEELRQNGSIDDLFDVSDKVVDELSDKILARVSQNPAFMANQEDKALVDEIAKLRKEQEETKKTAVGAQEKFEKKAKAGDKKDAIKNRMALLETLMMKKGIDDPVFQAFLEIGLDLYKLLEDKWLHDKIYSKPGKWVDALAEKLEKMGTPEAKAAKDAIDAKGKGLDKDEQILEQAEKDFWKKDGENIKALDPELNAEYERQDFNKKLLDNLPEGEKENFNKVLREKYPEGHRLAGHFKFDLKPTGNEWELGDAKDYMKNAESWIDKIQDPQAKQDMYKEYHEFMGAYFSNEVLKDVGEKLKNGMDKDAAVKELAQKTVASEKALAYYIGDKMFPNNKLSNEDLQKHDKAAKDNLFRVINGDETIKTYASFMEHKSSLQAKSYGILSPTSLDNSQEDAKSIEQRIKEMGLGKDYGDRLKEIKAGKSRQPSKDLGAVFDGLLKGGREP